MKKELIYNVTVKVNTVISEEWLTWLLEEHVPDVLSTGCFLDARVVQLLEMDDSDGPTYAIQYTAAHSADYERYLSEFAAVMRKKGVDKWGDQFVAFRSIMKVIH